MGTVISPSILRYEQDLSQNARNINDSMYHQKVFDLIAAGAEVLHIEILRTPFAMGDAFKLPLLTALYNEFRHDVSFDYQIAATDPVQTIRVLGSFIEESDQEKHNVSVHREAYEGSQDRVTASLAMIREKYGFSARLALQTGTSIDKITEEMFRLANGGVLLMTVPFRKGAETYRSEIEEKIQALRAKYNGTIQVAGGIDLHTIGFAFSAGANNFVVGTYLTDSRVPGAKFESMQKQIGALSLNRDLHR